MNENYFTYPNVNPYTGKQGTIQPNNYYSTLKYHNSIFQLQLIRAEVMLVDIDIFF
jgi:hypothetical protein